jgi:hypothetical protein
MKFPIGIGNIYKNFKNNDKWETMVNLALHAWEFLRINQKTVKKTIRFI